MVEVQTCNLTVICRLGGSGKKKGKELHIFPFRLLLAALVTLLLVIAAVVSYSPLSSQTKSPTLRK